MVTLQALQDAIPHALHGVELTGFGAKLAGKVRDSYTHGAYRVLITTDRVSAFDRVLGVIPYKGQVLNQLSAWWFSQMADIVRHHVVAVPDPNVTVAHRATPLPVEVVVRGYITGITSTSLWTLYANGDRTPYGIPLPDGLKKNDALPHPIITPTTKAQDGAHDERITRADILAQGLVAPHLWEQVERAALALFARGQALAERAGLILVDTKYEFGLVNGELCLIDEVHTPDSSRFWTRASYEAGEPESFSKEFLREWFVAQGYRGESTPPPVMPADFVADVASRYIRLYEQLTGNAFVPAELPAVARIQRALSAWQASSNEL
jgi:phosphoribosylaminoimidazole-succinocarboxamide synthase